MHRKQLDPGATPAPVGAETTGPDGPESRSAIHRWRLLAVLLAAQFIANVDTAIANIATPAFRSDLHASGGQAGLVVSSYVVAYAVLLVTGARLGASHGYRRIFMAGTALFTAASLACALAPEPVFLIVARSAQGAGAALMVPQVLSGIQRYFTGQERVRALGYYAIALSTGAVAGQTLGGLLIAADLFGTSWRPIFLINVPVGLVLMWAALRTMPRDEASEEDEDIDVRGMVLLASTVLLIIVPLLLGTDLGWPVWAWLSLAASVPVAAFFRRSQRLRAARGGRPLVAEQVVRHPAIRWSLVAHGITTMTYFALLFVLAIYLQEGMGRGPAYAGLAMVTWVGAFGLAGPLLARIPENRRAYMPALGCVILAAGYASVWIYLVAGERTGLTLFLLLGIGGLGLGISSNALIGQMTSVLPDRYAADLSGVISTNAQLCGALGVAALGGGYLFLGGSRSGESAADALQPFLIALVAASLFSALAARRGRSPAAA
ncbi:MFS transporter [Streptomyces sp. LP05-1]|uniref:MFS transporter n=1 Tax=Streptomyces pyxinae TaxID=2970734 RepID=A0ABT2CHY1_9ACTN|nr:MFS transporter [Streptomyces sp. LP05-1]MCS0636915.1 MFS transporter [Streptomyces sp. LP05-1]